MVSKTEVQRPLIAYTDETGNSGLNLFDPGQPFFWTGTLLTRSDLDGIDPAIHRACLDRSGQGELHGNSLGFSGIEKLAGKLQNLLYRYRMRFLFTRIEKTHLVGTKFVDTLLDSGINHGVSNFHYGIRINRLYLAHVIVESLNYDDREEFWEAYAKGDGKAFVRILLRLEARIESNVEDLRTRQLLLDAIHWATANPEPLLEGTRSDLDSPNVVALSLLVNVLHELNLEEGITIGTFVHDEQQQFAKWLKMAFDVSKRFAASRGTSPLAFMIDVKDMDTFACDFRLASSKKSFGLQILDVALWLVKRFTDNPDMVHGKCRELAEYIVKDALISNFTAEALRTEVTVGFLALEALPLSEAKEKKGRELLAQMEANRLDRMRDELPPPSI
jgi:hypothetical protein